MDFDETYYILYVRESLDNLDNDQTKSNHENRNKQIKRQYLAQKEAERVKYDLERNAKKAKEEKKKKLKFQAYLNAQSTR